MLEERILIFRDMLYVMRTFFLNGRCQIERSMERCQQRDCVCLTSVQGQLVSCTVIARQLFGIYLQQSLIINEHLL